MDPFADALDLWSWFCPRLCHAFGCGLGVVTDLIVVPGARFCQVLFRLRPRRARLLVQPRWTIQRRAAEAPPGISAGGSSSAAPAVSCVASQSTTCCRQRRARETQCCYTLTSASVWPSAGVGRRSPARATTGIRARGGPGPELGPCIHVLQHKLMLMPEEIVLWILGLAAPPWKWGARSLQKVRNQARRYTMAGPFVIADNMTRQVPLKENSFGVLAGESLQRITRDDLLK
jgi:hypothetical protein